MSIKANDDLSRQPLFRRGKDPTTEALMGGLGYDDRLIAVGFLTATEALAKALKTDALHTHSLVYPLVFCFRHYLELMFKHLLRILRSFAPLSEEEAAVALGQHDMRNLLNLILAAAESSSDSSFADSDDAKTLTMRVTEFHAKDASSFAFRYTRTKHGQPCVEANTSFDLEAFSNEMREVAAILFDVEAWCIDMKVAHVNAWADAVNSALSTLQMREPFSGAPDPRFMGGNVLQMQWTSDVTKRWVTCQLLEDKKIHMWFWNESDRGNYTEKIVPADPDAGVQTEAAEAIAAFLNPVA